MKLLRMDVLIALFTCLLCHFDDVTGRILHRIDTEKLVGHLRRDETDGKITFYFSQPEKKCQSLLTADDLFFVSNFSFTREKIADTLGPDEMYVEIAGKTLQTFVPEYIGCSSHKVQFFIEYSGAYHLAVILTRSNYSAVNEFNNFYPLIDLNVLHSEWVWIDGSNRDNESPSCPYEFEGVWEASLQNLNLRNGAFDSLQKALTLPVLTNSRGNLSRPLYVKLGNNPAHSCVSAVTEFFWNGQRCGHLTISSGSPLLRGLHLIFMGDSQIRTLNVHIYSTLCKERLSMADKAPIFYPTDACPHLSMEHVYNRFCDSSLLPNLTDLQVKYPRRRVMLFVNCGHHFASSNRLPAPLYRENLTNFVSSLLVAGYSPENLFWVESVAFPLRQDYAVVDFQDWRSLDRIRLYNTIANEIMHSHNFTILRQFQAMLPFLYAECDLAHYLSTDCYSPTIQKILRILSMRSDEKNYEFQIMD